MTIISIETEAYQNIIERLEKILEKLSELHKGPKLKDDWLDNQNVSQLLKISLRTLQSYRDSKLIPFSKIRGKIYYKSSDIDLFLESGYEPLIHCTND